MAARRLLDTTDLFAALPSTVRDDLREKAVTRSLHRGEVLFAQGDPSTELFVVIDGQIAIATRSRDGRESLVAMLDAGGLFGELGLFDEGSRSADARALTESTVLSLAYEHVREVLRARPELLWYIVRLLAQRLRATDEALADAVFLDVPARTAKRLLELAGAADDVQLSMTQEELAGLIGASRERVNKALALFAKLGWIQVLGRGRYRITDRDALVLRADP